MRANVLWRPPAHPAEKDQACGFCPLAHALKHVQTSHGFEKCAVFARRVTQGNGVGTARFNDLNVPAIPLRQQKIGFRADTRRSATQAPARCSGPA